MGLMTRLLALGWFTAISLAACAGRDREPNTPVSKPSMTVTLMFDT
jgi:hypothetical protein